MTRLLAAAFCALLASQPAWAQVTWTDWISAAGVPGTPGVATGLAGNVTVTYVGEVLPITQVSGAMGTNYWNPATPYLSASVPNAPPASEIIILQGQNASPITNTITFFGPVTNPLMAIVSLGRTSSAGFYDFGQPFTILSSGTGHFGGAEPDSLFEESGDVLRGLEGHGTIRFDGTFSQITWTATPSEFWSGFQVGLLPMLAIPEPQTYALLLAGLGLLGFVARRRT